MDVKNYRSRPLQAVRFEGANGAEIAEWVRTEDKQAGRVTFQDDRLYLATVEGTKIAMKGDFVLRDAFGSFYPVAADIFEAQYEEIA